MDGMLFPLPVARLAVGLMLVLTSAIVVAPHTAAQTLTGRVTDAQTGEPLPGATVALPSLDRGVSADATGAYTLTMPDGRAARVVFSYVGYTSDVRVLTVGPDGLELDVALAPSIVEAPDVVVSATSRASDILSTPQSVAVVDARMLDRETGGSVFDALDEVAGVRLLKTGPAIAKPVIRGLTAQRVLVVNDGVRQEGQGWGDEHAPEIGSADVDRIEVVRGPASLIYGSDALGGVVQTTQEDLFERGVHGSARAATASVTQRTDGDLHLGIAQDGWGADVRAGVLRAGFVRTPTGPILNTAQDLNTLSGRIGHQIGEGSVQIEAGTFQQEIGLFEPEAGDSQPEEEGDELVDETPGRFAIAQPSQRVVHNRAVARLELPLGGHRLHVVSAAQQNRRREFEEGEDEAALFLRLTTLTTDARIHHAPIGPVFGTVGVSAMHQRNETLAEETLIPGGTTLNGAVYVTEEFVLPTVTLDAGVRLDVRQIDIEATPDLEVDAQTRNYTALTGAVGAAWQPRPDVSVAVNLGRAFRAPVLQELFGNGVHEGTLRFERGDPTLKPETSLALDGVVRYLTPHVFAEISGFVNAISGYITPDPTGLVDEESGFQIYDFIQADARLAGVEARIDIHPHVLHGLGLHLAGDVTQGTDLDADEPLPFVPPARLRTAVEYRAGTLGRFQDVELRAGPTFVAAQRRPELVEEVPTDAYTTWDLSASAAIPTGGVTVTPVVAIDNVFDTAYVDPLSRYRPFGVSAPGRSVRLSLRVAF